MLTKEELDYLFSVPPNSYIELPKAILEDKPYRLVIGDTTFIVISPHINKEDLPEDLPAVVYQLKELAVTPEKFHKLTLPAFEVEEVRIELMRPNQGTIIILRANNLPKELADLLAPE